VAGFEVSREWLPSTARRHNPEDTSASWFASALGMQYRKAMTAAAATQEQIRRYRQMTGEQRLALALDLHELSCDVAREGIRRQHPNADAQEVERLLRRRLELARRHE
jgi:hypothetical protein